MKKHPMRFLPVILLFAVVACNPMTDRELSPSQVKGLAPIYATSTVYDSIEVLPARPTEKAGKIYAFNSYIFQVDQQKGIHIVNNSGPAANALKIAFLKIPFCTEVAVKGNFLYANNLNDLVVFDISNPTNPKLVNRLEDAFPMIEQTYPDARGYFECVDPQKGMVVGWEEKTLNNPKCQR